MTRQDAALVALGMRLRSEGYRFVTTTPLSHARANRRAGSGPRANDALRWIFGWNRAFAAEDLPPDLLDLMRAAEVLEPVGAAYRCTIRVSTLEDLVFVHSGFPTAAGDAVFFGPDTYRFARAIRGLLREPGFSPRSIVDIGAGSGAGGLYAASLLAPGQTAGLLLTDINDRALRLCAVNAAINGIADAEIRRSDILQDVPEPFDLALCNPPYLCDPAGRLYRHGGGPWGFDLSLRVVDEALTRLAPQGRLLLYTGSPIVGGADLFLDAVRPLLEAGRVAYSYEEIDPDVFGEELEAPPYDAADRIAVVLLQIRAPAADIHRTLAHAG